jgi:reactive intermediate/imine deaminase
MKPSLRHLPHPSGLPLSRAVVVGSTAYLSGQVAADAQGRLVGTDVTTQTRHVLESIQQTLAELGAGMADVFKATVWLADMADFAAFNQEYRRHFDAATMPARSTVQAGLFPGVLVEIEVQAVVDAR